VLPQPCSPVLVRGRCSASLMERSTWHTIPHPTQNRCKTPGHHALAAARKRGDPDRFAGGGRLPPSNAYKAPLPLLTTGHRPRALASDISVASHAVPRCGQLSPRSGRARRPGRPAACRVNCATPGSRSAAACTPPPRRGSPACPPRPTASAPSEQTPTPTPEEKASHPPDQPPTHQPSHPHPPRVAQTSPSAIGLHQGRGACVSMRVTA
jgi:hypothetical protein